MMQLRTSARGLMVLFFTVLFCPAQAQPLDEIQFRDWSGVKIVDALPDGSIMTEYAAQSDSLSTGNIVLRVGFIPRFACTPLVGIIASDADWSPAQFAKIDVLIDGTPTGYPTLVDQLDEGLGAFFNGGQQRRIALRLQVDEGDIATISLADDTEITFSLLGSRKALAAAQTLCRLHQPLPID